VKNGLDRRGEALSKAVARFLRRRARAGTRTETIPWQADYFGLERVQRFRRSNAAERESALAGCAAALLDESWKIERSGIVFCAKMVLLAESSEEKRLFALIGADEATHSAWLEPWIADAAMDVGPFNRFITSLVETGGAQPLTYLLQVVLEGFGVAHYSGLAAACRDEALAATLAAMAQDEALHHGAGLAAFSAARLSAPERRFVSEAASDFLRMMRSGPQSVVAALDRVVGVGSAGDAAQVFEELNFGPAAKDKLQRLRRLMAQPGMEWLIEDLDRGGAFAPCDAAQCAAVYVGAR
jgi:hypothetical protein